MTKTHTTVNVDDKLLKEAEQNGLNRSQLLEWAIRQKIRPDLNNIPKEQITLKCSQCSKEIKYGFLCMDSKIFLCQECQDNYNMKLCKHDKLKEHMHIRIPGFEGQNKEYLKEIQNG